MAYYLDKLASSSVDLTVGPRVDAMADLRVEMKAGVTAEKLAHL